MSRRRLLDRIRGRRAEPEVAPEARARALALLAEVARLGEEHPGLGRDPEVRDAMERLVLRHL